MEPSAGAVFAPAGPFQVTLVAEDVLALREATVRHFPKVRRAQRLGRAVGVLLGIFLVTFPFLLFLLLLPLGVALAWGVSLCAFLAVVLAGRAEKRRRQRDGSIALRQSRRQHAANGPFNTCHLNLSPKGVAEEGVGWRLFYGWEIVEAIERTPNHLFFWLGHGRGAMILPARCCPRPLADVEREAVVWKATSSAAAGSNKTSIGEPVP